MIIFNNYMHGSSFLLQHSGLYTNHSFNTNFALIIQSIYGVSIHIQGGNLSDIWGGGLFIYLGYA